MISNSQLLQLLIQFRQLFPEQQFEESRLADFLTGTIFELRRKQPSDLGTTLLSATRVLDKKLSDRPDSIIQIARTNGLTGAFGFGLRGIDTGSSAPLAESLINLARKVIQ